jgi:hypothetical protein
MVKISHATKEQKSYKKLINDLEESLKTDILYHQKQMIEYERKDRFLLS